MATAAKAVTADYKSCFHSVGSVVAGIDALAELALDYTVGNTVTPDPDLETSVKLGIPELARHAAPWGSPIQTHGSSGLYVWIDNPDLPGPRYTEPFTGSGGSALRVAADTAGLLGQYDFAEFGHVVIIDYDPADVVGTLPCWDTDQYVWTLQLLTCTVESVILHYLVVSDDGRTFGSFTGEDAAEDEIAALIGQNPRLDGHLSIVTY